MSEPNKIIDLTEIATTVLVNELKRRAVAKGMTTEELLSEAKTNWDKAEEEAQDLANSQ